METGDGSFSAVWSIFVVVGIFTHVANKGEFTNTALLKNNALMDCAVFLEQIVDVLLREFLGEVLDIEVVDDATNIITVFWLEGNGNAGTVFLRLLEHRDGSLGIFRAIVGDKAIATGGMAFIHGDL